MGLIDKAIEKARAKAQAVTITKENPVPTLYGGDDIIMSGPVPGNVMRATVIYRETQRAKVMTQDPEGKITLYDLGLLSHFIIGVPCMGARRFHAHRPPGAECPYHLAVAEETVDSRHLCAKCIAADHIYQRHVEDMKRYLGGTDMRQKETDTWASIEELVEL